MKSFLITLVLFSVLFPACRQSTSHEYTSLPVTVDSSYGFVIADTIIYDMLIHNNNPDDLWAEERLSRLDRRLFIDNVFTMVYSGEAMAYDHTTGEKLTPKQVENIEKAKGFSRDNIDMIQFKEAWYMNPDKKDITKKVISMVFGSQVIDAYGQYVANRAVFRVELNN